MDRACDISGHDLIRIKSNITQNIEDFNKEKHSLQRKIIDAREERAQLKKKRTEAFVKLHSERIILVDAQREVEAYSNYLSQLNSDLTSLDKRVRDEVQLVQFEQDLVDLRSTMEGAITFYDESNLQMELSKRANLVRERRIEYTKIETEFNELSRKIEEQKRERERIKREAAERELIELERQKQLEEERFREEEARKRDSFRQQRVNGLPSANGIGGIKNGVDPPFLVEAEPWMEPRLTKRTSSVCSNYENSFKASLSRASSVQQLPNFSQFLRWNDS